MARHQVGKKLDYRIWPSFFMPSSKVANVPFKVWVMICQIQQTWKVESRKPNVFWIVNTLIIRPITFHMSPCCFFG